MVSAKPLDCSALGYSGAAVLNSASSQDRLAILLLMAVGRCLMIDGGLLDWAWIYSGGLFGLQYGLNFSVIKLSVMSR